MKKAAPKSGFFDTLEAISSKRRKRLQQQLLPSYRKRPGPWQRSAKPAGATFSCLCPQKGCQKIGGLGTVFKARDPIDGHKGRGCIATGVAPHSAIDYTMHRAIPYRPKVVHGIPSLERCKEASKSARQRLRTAGSVVHCPTAVTESIIRMPARSPWPSRQMNIGRKSATISSA